MSESPGTEAAKASEEATSPAGSNATSPAKKNKEDKIDVLLKATGDAPILKNKKWQVLKSKTMGGIIEFLKKLIKADSSESLFIYVNQSFSPAPDVEVGRLYECFGSDGKLVLHYCKTQAWG